MKNIIFFITHATLGEDHADMCFYALSLSKDPIEFDQIVIYNTHQHELSNETVKKIYDRYRYRFSFIKNVVFFNYDDSTAKNLSGDFKAIRNYCLSTYDQNDRILLLKSDCLVSVNLLNELKKMENIREFILTPPFINAKQSVKNHELLERASQEYPILSSTDTFFIENETRSPENDFRNRPGVTPGDKAVKFLACTGKADWSCHFITVNLLGDVIANDANLGQSCNFERIQGYWIGTYKSFIVHKYHGIKSANRDTDRPGEYGSWLKDESIS